VTTGADLPDLLRQLDGRGRSASAPCAWQPKARSCRFKAAHPLLSVSPSRPGLILMVVGVGLLFEF
jgi:hypothetical protein